MSFVHRDKEGQGDAVQALAKILSAPGLPNATWSIGAGTGRRLDGRLHDGHTETELRQHIQDYADEFGFTTSSAPAMGPITDYTRLQARGHIGEVEVTVWVPLYPAKPKTIRSRATISVQRPTRTSVSVDLEPLRELVREVVLKTAAPEMRDHVDALRSAVEACDGLGMTREQQAGYADVLPEHQGILDRYRDALDAIVAEVPETLFLRQVPAETLGTLLLEAVREQTPVRNVAGAATGAGGTIPAPRAAVADTGPVDWSASRGAA